MRRVGLPPLMVAACLFPDVRDQAWVKEKMEFFFTTQQGLPSVKVYERGHQIAHHPIWRIHKEWERLLAPLPEWARSLPVAAICAGLQHRATEWRKVAPGTDVSTPVAARRYSTTGKKVGLRTRVGPRGSETDITFRLVHGQWFVGAVICGRRPDGSPKFEDGTLFLFAS